MEHKMKIVILLTAVLFAGCVKNADESVKGVEKIQVKSVFGDGERIPTKYTCDGEDVSPPLTIEGISPNAKSIAIIVDDPDAPVRVFTHWVIWNIPPVSEIPEAIPRKEVVSEPIKAVQGKNDFGDVGYGGPCPPPGKPHTYRFKVYVLDTMLDLKPRSSKEELEKAMDGHVIQYGELRGVYGR